MQCPAAAPQQAIFEVISSVVEIGIFYGAVMITFGDSLGSFVVRLYSSSQNIVSITRGVS